MSTMPVGRDMFPGNFGSGPYSAEQSQALRKQRLAEMLMQQGMRAPQAQQGGRFAVPISPLQSLAQIGSAAAGGMLGKQAGEQASGIAQKQQADRGAVLSEAIKRAIGSPQPAPELGGGPAMPADPVGAMGTLAQSQDPMTMQMGAPAVQMAQKQQMDANKPRQAPPTREIPMGSIVIKQEMQPDGSWKEIGRGHKFNPRPVAEVNVTNKMPGDDDYLKERRKQQATRFSELEKSAESAYKRLDTLDRFLSASKQGTAGGAQPIITAAQNFISSFGYSPESLKNVAVMEQAIGDILGTKMAELGARGLTDRDMEILRQALPRVGIAPEAREAVVGILKKSDEFTLNEYANARGEEARIYPEFASKTPEQAWFKTYKAKKNAPGSAPPGVDPQLWELMGPEDRALWKN